MAKNFKQFTLEESPTNGDFLVGYAEDGTEEIRIPISTLAFEPAKGNDDNFVTDAEKTVIGNTSGTNTGDQDLSGYQLKPSEGAFENGDKTKLDAITGTNTGDQDLSGLQSATAPFWTEVVLTASGADIASGTGVAYMTHMVAGTITDVNVVCDPANEPSASSVEVDLLYVDLSTGSLTSRLSAVCSIATSANVSTGGTLNGTQSVSVGDQSAFSITQGSDGKELRALVQITPS